MKSLLTVAIVILLAGCAREQTQPEARSENAKPPESAAAVVPVELRSESIEPPKTAKGSMAPFLSASPEGVLYMSWIEPAGKGGAVRMSTFNDGRWSEPSTIVSRKELMVNWADFPSVVAGPGNRLMTQWLQRNRRGKYAYDIYVAGSADGGKSWSAATKLHSDQTASEHGFVSIAPQGDGTFVAAWLDGRETGGGHHAGGMMTLRMASFDVATNSVSAETLLDPSVCDCCQTGIAMVDGTPVVAYRDRSKEEIRDISLISAGGVPQIVHNDNWQISGCPVNGPQIDSRGDASVVAWFTAPAKDDAVKVAFARKGAAIGTPVRIDSGRPVGRVDVAMLDESHALAVWIEQEGEGAAIVARSIDSAGNAGPVLRVGPTTSARNAGFPRMTLIGETAYVAWTDSASGGLRVAKVVSVGVVR